MICPKEPKMNVNFPFKLGATVRFRQDHIEDEGISLRVGQRGQVIGYDTPFLVRVRMNADAYTTSVRPREVGLCR